MTTAMAGRQHMGLKLCKTLMVARAERSEAEFFQADEEYIDAALSLYGIGVHTTC